MPGDLEFIGAHRTNSNRLGIAVQLCFLRHPGRAWTPEERIPATMLRWIAGQVNADPGDIEGYAKRDPTRREHFLELLQEYGWQNFGLQQFREMSAWLMNQARTTDLGTALITLGTTLAIEGLWALRFGNDGSAGPATTLFFTAGPNDELNGLLGTLTPIASEKDEADEQEETRDTSARDQLRTRRSGYSNEVQCVPVDEGYIAVLKLSV